jgi:hypothetical protein
MLPVVTDKLVKAARGTMLVCPVSPQATVKKEVQAVYCCDEKVLHGFRSSLGIIIGYAEMMLDGTLGQMTEEQLDGIKDVLATSRKMENVIDDVSGRKTPVRR